MDEQLKNAKRLFYEKNYESAKEIFIKLNETYEAGLCAFLAKDLKEARRLFEIKENDCTASSFGITMLDVIENKTPKKPTYFQVRSFFEIYINLLIENKLFEWAQKIIDNYGFFTNSNIETPKFTARVLNANNFNNAVHFFAQRAKSICFYDAEIYYIEASLYIHEKKYEEAKKSIDTCLSFAPEYYPILKLAKSLEEKTA